MRVPIANIEFDDVTMEEAVQLILDMSQRHDAPRHVCTGNLDHLAMLSGDSDFREAYAGADLVLADGAPVVWLSRLSGGGKRLRERVAGSDLFWELGRESAATGTRLFLLGGRPGAADGAAEALRRRYPGVTAGVYCPPETSFDDPAEQARIVDLVNLAKPQILLVAFGAPKQEKWIHQNKIKMNVPVSIGVGGSFEMAAGTVRRAPVWMRRSGLEWMFRFAQEPVRLFERYFMRDLPFLMTEISRALLGRFIGLFQTRPNHSI